MATFKWDSSEYIKTLEKLGKESESTIKKAVYQGAKVVADEIKAGLHEHRDSGELEKSMTLTRMQTKKNYTYTKVLFVGYDTAKRSKAFPRGVPNAVKAAALESGTSKQPATHVISRAVKAATPAAIDAMRKAFDDAIGEIVDGK